MARVVTHPNGNFQSNFLRQPIEHTRIKLATQPDGDGMCTRPGPPAEVRLAARLHPHQLEPGLREAESMYREIGALGHADRLLKVVSG